MRIFKNVINLKWLLVFFMLIVGIGYAIASVNPIISNTDSYLDVLHANYIYGDISNTTGGNTNNSYSYLIWKDGTNYYSKNGITGKVVYSGTKPQDIIMSSLNATESGGGGTVKIMNGTYTLSRRTGDTGIIGCSIISMKNNTVLEGLGESTILKEADNIVLAGQDGLSIIDSSDCITNSIATNWAIKNLHIEGSKIQTTDTNIAMNTGIWIRQLPTIAPHKSVYVDGVSINGTISAGVYVEDTVAHQQARQNVYISNVVVNSTGKAGILTNIGGIHFDEVSFVNLHDSISNNNYRGLDCVDCSNIIVRNLRTEKNDYGTIVETVSNYASNNSIEVFSKNDNSYGLYLDGQAGKYNITDSEFMGSVIQNGGSQAVWVRYTTRNSFKMKVQNPNGAGVLVRDTNNSRFDFDIYNVRGSGESGATFSTNFNNNTVEGYVSGSSVMGIDLTGTGNLLYNIRAMDNSQEVNNAYDEIRINGSRNILNGCIIASTKTNRAKYGVNVIADSSLVTACSFWNPATADITISGTSSKGVNNIYTNGTII